MRGVEGVVGCDVWTCRIEKKGIKNAKEGRENWKKGGRRAAH